LIRITADLEILDDRRIVYSEPDFPVVELVAALVHWSMEPDPQDFEFDSMSTPEPGWVWVRRSEVGWRVGSTPQEGEASRDVAHSELVAAVSEFRSRLVSSAKDVLGINLIELVPSIM
jgi:hypothetical protein